MEWVLDIGHTHYHIGYFEAGALRQQRQGTDDLEELVGELSAKAGIVSSVRQHLHPNLEALIKRKKEIHWLCSALPLPISIAYETKDTLGSDRIAAVVGAIRRFPDEKLLVISIGTCITYTYYTPSVGLIGGGISPGIEMRAHSLHHFTDPLPHVQPNYEQPKLVGQSTHQSIQSGLWYGVQKEIEGTIAEYMATYGPVRCILCGGGAKSFWTKQKAIKNCILVQEDLILWGLYSILEYVRKG